VRACVRACARHTTARRPLSHPPVRPRQTRAKKLKARVDARHAGKRHSAASLPAFARSPGTSPGVATRTRGAVVGGASDGSSSVTTYTRDQKILVVGDGDFSFSHGLVKHRGGQGAGLTLTSYDSAPQVLGKYKTAKDNLVKAKAAGATVLHGVDATNLAKTFGAGDDTGKFDRIVFNFPHSGSQRVHINRELLHKFFLSARNHLRPKGQAHVTLKMRPPYSEWQVALQAKRAG
jgi:hypothetical protein